MYKDFIVMGGNLKIPHNPHRQMTLEEPKLTVKEITCKFK